MNDGHVVNNFCMLASNLSYMVDGGRLEPMSIVRLKRYMNVKYEDHTVLILNQIELVTPGSVVSLGVIGNPQILENGVGEQLRDLVSQFSGMLGI